MNSDSKHPLIIPYTDCHKFKSEINNFEYELFVLVPPGYRDSKNSYPVIFTTDPNFIFSILLGATKSLEAMIPDTIIVGIGHADFDFEELDKITHDKKRDILRARDFLPWPLGDWDPKEFPRYFPHINQELEGEMIQSSGAAKNFVNVIKTEVLPFIDKTYRTSPERTLIGHSFGGVFASWIMLNHSEMFQNYLIISPILDLRNGSMFNEISHFFATTPTKIYFCAGSLEALNLVNKNFLTDLEKFHKQINLLPNTITKAEIFEDESHASVVPFGLLKGLRFIYEKTQN